MAENRSVIKIPESLGAELNTFQAELRVKTGKKVPLYKLMAEAWRVYRASMAGEIQPPTPSSQSYPYAALNRELHDKLEAVLNSGDEAAVQAIAPAVELFFARMKPASARRRAGA